MMAFMNSETFKSFSQTEAYKWFVRRTLNAFNITNLGDDFSGTVIEGECSIIEDKLKLENQSGRKSQS